MTIAKTVVLDCDDVLLEWSQGFKSFVEATTPHRQQIDENTTFSIGSQYGVPVEDGLRWVDQFNTSFYFQHLQPTPGARRAVNWLIDDGFDIHVITACGTDPSTTHMRRRNLDNVFGVRAFKHVEFVPGGHSKSEYLQAFPGSYFVDDALSNCEAARDKTQVVPVFMENYMNSHLPWNGLRINSLVQFYNSFIAEPLRA